MQRPKQVALPKQVAWRLRGKALAVAERVSPGTVEALRRRRSGDDTGPLLLSSAREIAELKSRVAELEAEVQENRQLNSRLAELIDVVEELLVPIAQRDEARLAEVLERSRPVF